MTAGQLTVSGNEITDVIRRANVEGDGATFPDYSYGIYKGTTNLIKNGNADISATTNTASDTGGVRTRDLSNPYYGTTRFKLVTPGTSTNEGMLWLDTLAANGNIPAAGNTTYTIGMLLWGNAGGELMQIAVTEILNGANVTSYANDTSALTSGWVKYYFTFTTQPTTNQLKIGLRTKNQNAYTVFVAGVQLEIGAVATAYKDTTGSATATRGASRVQLPITDINGVQSWVVVRAQMYVPSTNAAVNQYLFSYALPDGTDNNHIGCGYMGATGKWETRRVAAGVGLANKAVVTDAFSAKAFRTVGTAWDAANIKLSVGGANFVSAANAGVPAGVTTFDLGQYFQGNDFLNGSIKWAACGYGTLTNADIAAFNALGNNYPTFGAFLSTGIVDIWTGQSIGYYTSKFGGLPLKALEATYSQKALETPYALHTVEASYTQHAVETPYTVKVLEPTYKPKAIETAYKTTGVDIEY